MACTCSYEYSYEGNVVLGRNRVMCQECTNNNAAQGKEARKREIMTELLNNDLKIIRAITENDNARINNHKNTQASLRAELAGL